MALFPGTPKLESRNCPEIVPVGVPGLWELISPDYQIWSRRGLNQSYSSLRDLSNAMSHSWFGRREEVYSRLLVVGSQIVSLTPGPSFAHNLGCRCPNDQCEGILDIYTSRPFQWHQEHHNARCFGLCCWTLNIRESRRTPNPQLWEWEFHPPTSPKVGLRQNYCAKNFIAFYKKNSSTFHALQNGLCNCDLKANLKNSWHEIIIYIKQKETTNSCATLESKTTIFFFQNFHMIISRVWTLRLVTRLF